MSYYIKGNWDFKKKIKYVAADTETHLYYNNKKLTEQQAEQLMKDNGQAWCKQNIEVRAWAYMLSDGINFICFDNIKEFINCCCKNRIEIVIWYNAKFDFLFFDYYFLTNNWNYSSEIAKDFASKNHYGKMPAKTYSSLNGKQGQRYSMTIWEQYIDGYYRIKVHKFKMIDLCNITPGGLAKNLEDWKVKDSNGNDIRKLEMDYVNDNIQDCIDYLYNDTAGLKMLADVVDKTIFELSGYSLWKGDYITIGGLAKKVLLSHMYNDLDSKKNIKRFHLDFPMTAEQDKLFRENHLYKGGMSIVNPHYIGKVVHNVYKFDENSMYPHKMKYMYWLYGNGIYKEKIEDNNAIKIIHITLMDGKIYADKIPVFYDNIIKEYVAVIHERKPFFIFEEELEELKHWYDLDYEYDYVIEYKGQRVKGVQEFVDKYYKIKSTEIGTKKNASKLIINSSYGKLAEKIEREYGHYVLSDKGYVVYQVDGKKLDAKNILSVINGAYITAQARIDLMQKIRKVCNEDVYNNFIYCDTDSIHSLTDNIETDNKELGMLKNEGYNYEPYQDAIYLAPKSYLMYNPHSIKEPFVLHCKGVSTKEVYKLIDGHDFEYALKIFKPNNPIRCLTGINAIGGKALIYKEKFILRQDGDSGSMEGGDMIFYEV